MTGDLDGAYARMLADAEVARTADALAAAEAHYAEVPLIDRVRACVGVVVSVRLISGEPAIAGRLTEVVQGALLLRDAVQETVWLVPLSAVSTISGLVADHRGPADRVAASRTMASALRQLVGFPLLLGLPGATSGALLQRVGRDHLQLLIDDVPTVVPLAALQWVSWSADSGAAGRR